MEIYIVELGLDSGVLRVEIEAPEDADEDTLHELAITEAHKELGYCKLRSIE
ncbi:hypothetical protein SmaMPs15_000181 [Stenotrophomonas maltophilia phage vB_SmaM_Ps15]|uniref:Uncharacterized protein n=1 Tax=Stenotrophomonas maltophilia phage vB_SmaM_Ps15 TaxID=3071007 RepID=A0AAE9FLF4_9CAUD|nr:hypothetical protein PQC01_gp181 [Stenotrophomonas maltophilia phage vB_SmaM_Ps15]QXN67456.1 hypothetical protein [Stenotrophomonas phage BUCT608]QYC97594.1 hypothetical protein [Stenotrophomonas phage BUCT608]UMO77332.1 hypothetical protein SmaMPs15_000181 [Stenotrophomonas maltophilia phage vB_SmaM_Ps15]